MPPDAGTATVDCGGKKGKYLTIELPGIEEMENPGADDPQFRILNLNEVKVFRPLSKGKPPPYQNEVSAAEFAYTNQICIAGENCRPILMNRS